MRDADAQVAATFGMSEAAIYNWLRQEKGVAAVAHADVQVAAVA